MARISLSEIPHDIWVVVELEAGAPTPLSLELVYGARMTADMMGFYVKAAVLGGNLPDVSEALIQAGADRVYLVELGPASEDASYRVWLKALADLFAAQSPEFVLFGATPMGESLAPRLAQRFGGGLISGCLSLRVDDFDRAFVGRRAVYGGAYYEVIATRGPSPQFATALPGCFGPVYSDASRFGETERIDLEIGDQRLEQAELVDFQMPRPRLKNARRIVSVGRQVGDVEAAKRLASALGAEFAGAREAIDEGYIDESQVVGITGARVSPDVYVALGIRGDTLHAFGIQDARLVIAVHPDPEAPIFAQADAGLAGEPKEIVPKLIEAIEQAG